MTTTMLLTPRLRADAITFGLGTRHTACSSSVRAMLVYVGSNSGARFRVVGWLCMAVMLWAAPSRTHARASDLPLIAPDALNGGRYVASALGTARPSLRLAATLGYGFTESVLAADDRHHRLAGELAIALVVAPWFQAALGGELRVDRHTPDGPGSETGLLGSSQLVTRHVLALGKRVGLGFSPRAVFPGAEDAARGFRAASYELKALLSALLPRQIELSLNAGYRVDRTRFALAKAAELSPPQRLAAGLSEQNAYLLGALVALPLGAYRLAAEWSWELQSGGRVHARESPMRVRGALQRVVGERFLVGVEIGVDTSTRPLLLGLTRIEPRVWARLGLAVLLERRAEPKAAAKIASAREAPSAPPPLRSVTLRILGLNGVPIAGAHIIVPNEGEQNEYTTDAHGNVTLQVPSGVTAVTIEAEGYEPLWRTLGSELKEDTAVALKPALPPAEIKGIVRNLAGDPVHATVTLRPQALTVRTDARGQFAIGVAPGDYMLEIAADGYEPQERRAQAELRGVTIIVVDLRKAVK